MQLELSEAQRDALADLCGQRLAAMWGSSKRDLIRTRTGEGRERAKARGQAAWAAPFKLTPHHRSEAICRHDRGEAFTEIARSYNVSPSTIS
jgi:DNA invertase Pin-like site-specific DNA recombinase